MNTFGSHFRLTTFGESHGTAVGGVVDGCPAGMEVDSAFVEHEVCRRRMGDTSEASTLLTARHDDDRVEWLSGIYEGHTLGTPIAFLTYNTDCRPEDYEALRHLCRPGHADYTCQQKYGLRDPRGGGRASGRETVARVVAGALAKQFLRARDIAIHAQVAEPWITCTITGMPEGVGEPVFDRLNARLSYAMLSIPSAMSFVVGAHPDAWRLPADLFPDAWNAHGAGANLTATNHCGGIQGGISNGMPVQFHVGFHLPVTHEGDMQCRDAQGALHTVTVQGRHDSNHRYRLPVVVEAMAALTVADLVLQATSQQKP